MTNLFYASLRQLILIVILLSACQIASAQNDNPIDSLNTYTVKTQRNGYDVIYIFTEKGLELSYPSRGKTFLYEWNEIQGIARTEGQRIYVSFTDDTFEYVTPKEGRRSYTWNLLKNVLGEKGRNDLRILTAVIKDADGPR